MANIDARAGMNRFLASTRNTPGMCLQHTWQMYGSVPSIGPHAGQYPVALNGWLYSTQKHPGDYDAPAGAAVYFGVSPNRTDANKNAGDVGISIGGGNAVFTDGPSAGKVGILSIAARAKRINRPYLGWTSDFLGHQLTNLGTQTAAAHVTPITPDPLKEGKMLIVYGNITGESRKFLIDPWSWTRREITVAEASVLGYANIPTIGMNETTMNLIPYKTDAAPAVDVAALSLLLVSGLSGKLGVDVNAIAAAVNSILADDFAAVAPAVVNLEAERLRS